MLPDWTLAPVVAALQTMRGMALVNAATLIAELGDLSRFVDPRQLTSPSQSATSPGKGKCGCVRVTASSPGPASRPMSSPPRSPAS
jgi:hypothetical protein